jgi:hypothetical protein
MSTWHQDQAMKRARAAGKTPVFWHVSKWTVVSDPPNGLMCLMRFALEKEARDFAAKEGHAYVMPPGTGGQEDKKQEDENHDRNRTDSIGTPAAG